MQRKLSYTNYELLTARNNHGDRPQCTWMINDNELEEQKFRIQEMYVPQKGGCSMRFAQQGLCKVNFLRKHQCVIVTFCSVKSTFAPSFNKTGNALDIIWKARTNVMLHDAASNMFEMEYLTLAELAYRRSYMSMTGYFMVDEWIDYQLLSNVNVVHSSFTST